MKARLRQDIMEHLKEKGYRKDNVESFIQDPNLNKTFDVKRFSDGNYYMEEFGYCFQKEWLIFEEDKDEMQAVAEMKKEIDFLKDVIRHLIEKEGSK